MISAALIVQDPAFVRRIAEAARSSAPVKPRPTGDIAVVAAIVTDDESRVLVSMRRPSQHCAGWLEFPAGKIESGETPESAVIREVREETGLVISRIMELDRYVVRDMPCGCERVDLTVYIAGSHHGEARGEEGQLLMWLPIWMVLELVDLFVPSNVPVIHDFFMDTSIVGS